ncbi:MAG: hypothetical protein ACTS4U_01620 [Candidatus Hodgkinia cicadicola]
MTRSSSEITSLEYIRLLKQLTWRQRCVGRRLKSQLKSARALGDFSENAELQIAKAEAKANDVKIESLRRSIGEAEVINSKASRGRIGFNTMAILRSLDGQLSTLTLLGSLNVTWGSERVTAPRGGANCVGRKVGDIIMLQKERRREAFEVICVVAL